MRIKSTIHSIIALLTPLALYGQEAKPASPEAEKKLQIEKISDEVFKLGEIHINKKTREITFPATVEMAGTADKESQVVVEYVLVNPNGKIHESLFITKIKPSHLNVAFKLIGLKEAKHLFQVVNENFQPQPEYETATPEQKQKSRFNMAIKWENAENKQISHSISDLIFNASTKKPMQNVPWVYGGSFIYNGQYVADGSGDLFAIYTDRGALGNYAGEGRKDDTLWFPNHKIMPPMGTPVTFSITPFVEKK